MEEFSVQQSTVKSKDCSSPFTGNISYRTGFHEVEQLVNQTLTGTLDQAVHLNAHQHDASACIPMAWSSFLTESLTEHAE